MDGHKLRSIHGSRCFFTKDNAIDKITGQLEATRPIWKAWSARANAFKNVDPSRSYASVLQQSTSSTVDKYLEIVDNGAVTETIRNFTKDTFQSKPISTKNSSHLATAKKHTATAPYGQLHKKQGQPVPLANRFQVLAQLKDGDSSSQSTWESTNASFNLKGNKNGKGQTMGSAFLYGGQDTTGMESFNSFKGNENKTGKYWVLPCIHHITKGDQCHTVKSLSDKQHASLTFKDNKNGKG